MSNLKMIEMLCALVEEQSRVICHLSMELAHERNLTDAESQMVEQTRQQYTKIIGAGEVPDDLDMDNAHG